MSKEADLKLEEIIAGYYRISVDEELDRDNTSIENQKKIVEDFVKKNFPKCKLVPYEDRDKSGYTFEQRDGYQELRKRLLSGEIKILIVKDFSRFSRRNSKGLCELEDLRDAGIRIISIGDSIDYPTYDDWMAIQFRFLINEMPVTDASKKVRSVIRRRQEDGQWLCSVPYGYVITNMKKQEISVEPDEAVVIRKVFELYNEGWGYKKISNYLTEQHIPTPRTKEKERMEARGEECKRKSREEWSIVTVQGILQNDFYIGTLRQGKYKRKKINGADVKTEKEEQIVFEKHHEAIIDDRTWLITQDLLKQRTTGHYRGVKKYENVYSGLMVCGDCGSPMFSMSRSDIAPAYICGTYHKRGKIGCSSHHTRIDMLDAVLKQYIMKVRDNSEDMLEVLQKSVKTEATAVKENENTLSLLERHLQEAKEELKTITKQKIKEIAKLELQAENNPEVAAEIEIVEETYEGLKADTINKIAGLQNQIELTNDKRNDIIRINRMARTVIDVFNEIIAKPKLDKTDLQLLIDKIVVYEDHIDIDLKADIDNLLKAEAAREDENFIKFKEAIEVILNSDGHQAAITIEETDALETAKVRMKAKKQPEKIFTTHVVSKGDPLEIFTDREGEIILKKYSPIGELSIFAKQYAEAMAQTTGQVVAIADRDQFIAVAGSGKKDLLAKSVSRELETLMTERETLVSMKGEKSFIAISYDEEEYNSQVIVPIICEGDVIGAVLILAREVKQKPGEMELKIAQTAASFLGRQMES